MCVRFLYEETKNGSRHDHGFCFVNTTAVSGAGRLSKFTNGEEAPTSIANRMLQRNGNDIIIIPYNPRFDILFDISFDTKFDIKFDLKLFLIFIGDIGCWR